MALLKDFGRGAVAGLGIAIGQRLKWPIAMLGVAVFLLVNWVQVAVLAFAVYLRTQLGSWTHVAAVLAGLWVLWQTAKAGVAVRRGAARTASQILYGLVKCWQVRRGYADAAARTQVMSARNDASVVASASNWRPMERGIQFFVAYGALGRELEDVRTFCRRFPQQFNASRARAVAIPGVTIGCDVLMEWGAHLKAITSADVWALARQAGTERGMIPIGINEDGWNATVPANLSILIGGLTGTGKSVLIWNYILGCMMQGIRVRLWVIDPKGGVEFRYLKKHLGQTGRLLEVHRYEDNIDVLESDASYDQPGGFWWEFGWAIDKKQALAGQRGTRSLTVDDVSGAGTEVLDVLIVDEWLRVANTKSFASRGLSHPAARAVYMGRTAWVSVLAAAQQGQKTSTGEIRDLFPIRLAGATPNDFVTDSILGKNATKDGAAAHRLSIVHDKGIFYMASDTQQGYIQFRTANIGDREAQVIASGQLPDWGESMVDPNRPASVYRYDFSRDITWNGREYLAGQCAYIGEAYDADRRHAQHLADPEEWWANPRFCDFEVIETFHMPSLGLSPKELARLSEKDWILRERPLFNHTHNQDNPDRIAKQRSVKP
jgi:hypothetical protein